MNYSPLLSAAPLGEVSSLLSASGGSDDSRDTNAVAVKSESR